MREIDWFALGQVIGIGFGGVFVIMSLLVVVLSITGHFLKPRNDAAAIAGKKSE